jgi:hypothetical protein
MNPKEFAALFAKTIHAMKSGKPIDPQLQKSLDEEMANEFDRFIPDWEQPGEINKVPTAQTIIFGPTEASSGAGAARMVEQYSSFADQGGITALYAEFSRRMAPMRADMDAVKAEMATIKNSVFSLVKASEDAAAAAVVTPVVAKADDDDDEDEKTRMVEKARKTMRKARVLIVKAEDAEGGDSEEDGEEDEISEDMEKAARLLKGVKEDLTKAEEARKDDEDEDEEIEKARTMRKALVKRLSAVKKARAPAVVKTKEEEEAEEEAKKAAEAAKAKDNDKGNQEAAQNPANGNQEDAAAKSSEVSLLTKSVSELMDFLMTSASGGRINPAPVFQKAQQDKVASIAMAIDEAADNREISDSEAIDAQGIVARLEMIKSGQVDRKSVLDMLAKSSPKVQALFSRVA